MTVGALFHVLCNPLKPPLMTEPVYIAHRQDNSTSEEFRVLKNARPHRPVAALLSKAMNVQKKRRDTLTTQTTVPRVTQRVSTARGTQTRYFNDSILHYYSRK